MPSVTGTVKAITVTEAVCCVEVNKTAGGSATVLLWSYGTTAQEDNATNRLTHGTYLALTRDAYVNGKRVQYNHPNNNAIVSSVKIMGP